MIWSFNLEGNGLNKLHQRNPNSWEELTWQSYNILWPNFYPTKKNCPNPSGHRMEDFKFVWRCPLMMAQFTYQYDLADVVWFNPNFTSTIYGSAVHIRTVRIEENEFYFAIRLRIQAPVLDLPENGMWMLEHLAVKGPRGSLYDLHIQFLQALSRNFLK